MKAYTDILGNKLTKEDVAAAVRLMVSHNNLNTSFLCKTFGWGYGKAVKIMMLLTDAGVVTPIVDSRRSLILKTEDAAVNAALRQLKKGKG